MNKYYLNIFSFSNPKTYWQALTDQTHCRLTPPSNRFSSFSRIKNYIDLDSLLSKSIPVLPPDFKAEYYTQGERYYSNSLLETMYHLFWTGVFFRTLEILGCRLKSDLLKRTDPKYSPAVHIGFEALFLLTTILAAKSLDVPVLDYCSAKFGEYSFRGLGYIFRSSYAFMDYAAEVNLVEISQKGTIKDFAILKSFMFSKNCLMTALLQQINSSAKDPNVTLANGLYIVFKDEITYLKCFNNSNFLVKYPKFVNFMQEIGLFSGALAVDASLSSLKYVGILRDVNIIAIDPDYRNNITKSSQNAASSTALVAKKIYNAVIHYDEKKIPDTTTVLPVKVRNLKIKKQSIQQIMGANNLDTTAIEEIAAPQLLPENCVILNEGRFKNSGCMTYAINLCADHRANVFNDIFYTYLKKKSFKNCNKLVKILDYLGRF